MTGLWLAVHVLCAIMMIGLCLGLAFQTLLDRRAHNAAPAVLMAGLVLAGPCFAVLFMSGLHLLALMRLPADLPWVGSALLDGALAFVALSLGLACMLWRTWRGRGHEGARWSALVMFVVASSGFAIAMVHMLAQDGTA